MMLVSSIRAVVVAAVIGFLLAGCGEDDAVPGTPPPARDPIAALPVERTLRLPGLGGGSDVVFDDLGIPHVFSPDLESATFVQGYLTASARFWEMDVFRHFAEGRLTEMLGRLALPTDVGMRTVFTTRDGRRLEEALWEHAQRVDPEVSAVVRAYAAGVNAWLADLRAGRNGASLPPEYRSAFIGLEAEDLDEWRPQDTLAIARLQAYQLSETLQEEIDRARMARALPDAVFRDVYRSAPAATAAVLPGRVRPERRSLNRNVAPLLPEAGVLSEVSSALAEAEKLNPLRVSGERGGSNNWIVSPRLSANGHAMLANDPHLALFNPPIWHMIQIDSGPPAGPHDRVTGVIFPGLPGVILGHNDFGAWGGTVAVFDVTDVYVEDVETPADYPASPRTVLFQGRRVPVLRIEETFRVKRGSASKQVIEIVPHHGPMVPDPKLGDSTVGIAATGMSVRWTGHEITNDSRFLLDLNRARDVSGFRAALRNFAVGAQNWVWADVHGDIAYFPQALIPQRPAGAVPYLPMPGTGEAEWLADEHGNTLWLPEDRIPQATNPSEGFLATANNDQIGNTFDNEPLDDEIYLTHSADIGFREQRIQELLSNQAGVRPAGAKIAAADMSRYQYDHSCKEAARLLPFLFAAAQARADLVTPEMADALGRLRAWGEGKPGSAPFDAVSGIDAHDLRADVPPRDAPVSDEERADAVATSIFAAWEKRLGTAVFADDFAGTGVGAPGDQDATKALLHLLEDVDRADDGFRVHTKTGAESSLWDDRNTPATETREQILLAALRDGLAFLGEEFASTRAGDWLWGRIHTVQFQHFFAQAGFSTFDLGPFPAPGARYTVNPANFSLSGDSFRFASGPSQRFVAVLDPAGVRSVNSLPGGNNGDPGVGAVDPSDNYNRIDPAIHYGDLIPNWINGRTFENRVRRDDVAAHASGRVRFEP